MAPMYQLHVAEPDRISVAQPTDYLEQDQMSSIKSPVAKKSTVKFPLQHLLKNLRKIPCYNTIEG